MNEKINEVKVAILARIQKNVSDETKTLSAETIKMFADIANMFETAEMIKTEPRYNPNEYTDKLLEFFDKLVSKESEMKEVPPTETAVEVL